MPSPQDCAKRKALGADVAIDIDAYDEMNIRVPIEKIAARIKQPGHSGIVCLVGVQSNQFPRAMAIARQFRARGIAVAIGGFHVSGCISMLKELTAGAAGGGRSRHHAVRRRGRGAVRAVPAGCACRHGEAGLQLHARPAEPAAPDDPLSAGAPGQALRRRALLLRRRPRLPVPVLLLHHHQRAGPQVALARRRRHRAHRARKRARRASSRFFITDDNFARNKNWEPIFDRLIELREKRGARHHVPDPGRRARASDPELHREGGARRLPLRLHRAGEHQSGQSGSHEEEPEPHHRIPENVPGLEGGRDRHLCRLHHGAARRHAGLHQARRGDHPARAAGRPARVHHADAAAGLGGPPDPLQQGRLDGPRPQQIRPRERHRRASEDEHGGMAAGLSRRVELVLHRRARRAHDEAQHRLRHQAR